MQTRTSPKSIRFKWQIKTWKRSTSRFRIKVHRWFQSHPWDYSKMEWGRMRTTTASTWQQTLHLKSKIVRHLVSKRRSQCLIKTLDISQSSMPNLPALNNSSSHRLKNRPQNLKRLWRWRNRQSVSRYNMKDKTWMDNSSSPTSCRTHRATLKMLCKWPRLPHSTRVIKTQ